MLQLPKKKYYSASCDMNPEVKVQSGSGSSMSFDLPLDHSFLNSQLQNWKFDFKFIHSLKQSVKEP